MLSGLLFILLTGLAWCGVGVVTSRIVRRNLDYLTYGVQSCGLAALGAALLLVRWKAGIPPRAMELTGVFLVGGLFQALGFWWMQRAMRDGPHSLVWTIGQMALVIPFLAGVLLWHEPMGGRRCAGLLFVVLGVFLLGQSKPGGGAGAARAARSWAVPALLAFGCIGISQALCTIPSHWPGWSDSAGWRVPLILATTGMGYLGVSRFSPPGERQSLGRFSAAGAAVTLAGSFFLFLAMDRLAPFRMVGLAYPMAIGLCIVFFALYGRIFLSERQSKLGLLITVAGVIALAC